MCQLSDPNALRQLAVALRAAVLRGQLQHGHSPLVDACNSRLCAFSKGFTGGGLRWRVGCPLQKSRGKVVRSPFPKGMINSKVQKLGAHFFFGFLGLLEELRTHSLKLWQFVKKLQENCSHKIKDIIFCQYPYLPDVSKRLLISVVSDVAVLATLFTMSRSARVGLVN